MPAPVYWTKLIICLGIIAAGIWLMTPAAGFIIKTAIDLTPLTLPWPVARVLGAIVSSILLWHYGAFEMAFSREME